MLLLHLYDDKCKAMKYAMKSLFMIIFALTMIRAMAQPGEGGGGIKILHVYDRNLKEINLMSDTNIRIRTYSIDARYQEFFIWPQAATGFQRMRGDSVEYLLPRGNRAYEKMTNATNDRLFIFYKEDTMVADIMGIIGVNMAQAVDVMDSLVIQRGYFRYQCNDLYDTRVLSSGLTPHTKDMRASPGTIYYSDSLPPLPVTDDRQPANYFLKRARYFLKYKRPQYALTDIYTAIQRSNGDKDCETLFLLADAYTAIARYDSAIKYMSDAINKDCRDEWQYHREYVNPKYQHEYDQANKYDLRIPLLIAAGEYKRALLDHDSIALMSKDKLVAGLRRAEYRINYLIDYEGAIRDLKEVIEIVPPNPDKSEKPKWMYYGNAYFALATAEYGKGSKKAAYQHWLKAMSDGMGYTREDLTAHFDSLIRKDGSSPELYMCRALARLRGGDCKEECLVKYIHDADSAEQKGMRDARINYCRGIGLNMQQKYTEAIEEVNRGIQKEPGNPINYRLRSTIKWLIGDKEGNKADYAIYEELHKKTVFEK